MKRNKHNLSHYRLTTMEMGRLYPIGHFEVLPGDTVQAATSGLIRVTPLLAPVMHPVTVRIHHWFVPYRLLWDGWEDFITGGPDGTGADTPFPTIDAPAGTGFPPGELMDHFGIRPGVPGLQVSALPVRAYNLIFNEFYRDEDLVQESPTLDNPYLRFVAWEKDYFTSARPWPQKGPDITLPLGVSAPVLAGGDQIPTFRSPGGTTADLGLNFIAAQANPAWSATPGETASALWDDPKLYADLQAATAVDVNTVRRAFALQRYQEARSRFGSRYVEYLRYLGISPSDARLQRPEYLGGGKNTISFSEVLKTGGVNVDDDEPVGTLKGHGINGMRTRRYRRFFEEHGIVISLASVRPRTMYTDGTERMWLRRTKEEFWQKELEQIGQQAIGTREIYDTGVSAVFGWQDRYAEYKHIQSKVTGEFRELLNYWHYGRQFTSAPTLNEDFINCVPTPRVYAEQTQNPLWCMFQHRIVARRMVRRSGSSRIM